MAYHPRFSILVSSKRMRWPHPLVVLTNIEETQQWQWRPRSEAALGFNFGYPERVYLKRVQTGCWEAVKAVRRRDERLSDFRHGRRRGKFISGPTPPEALSEGGE